MILILTTCEDEAEAKKIGEHLLKRRLCACINILPEMHSMFWWPPKKNKLDQAEEAILIIKTEAEKYEQVEEEILKIHSYENPEVAAIPIVRVSQKYDEWLKGELGEGKEPMVKI
jgi:periplasmic divalent cation tolerance protein